MPTKRWFPKPMMEFAHGIFEAHLSLNETWSTKVITVGHTGSPWYSLPKDALKSRTDVIDLKKQVADAILNQAAVKVLVPNPLLTLIIKILTTNLESKSLLLVILLMYRFKQLSATAVIAFLVGKTIAQ